MAYDYTSMNGTATKARAVEDIIKADLQQIGRGFRAMIRVGDNLQKIKDLIPHGEWEKWVEQALEMSARNARRYMAVAKKFKDVSIETFTESVLALLVPSDVPDKAVKEVASSGAASKPAEAKKIVEKHKPEPKPPRKKAEPVNRIAKHLTGSDSPVEFANDDEPSSVTAERVAPPKPEVKPEVSAPKSIEQEVLDAFSERKPQMEDPSESAFEQAIEIIKSGLEIIKQLSPEYQTRARAMIDSILPASKSEADKLSTVGKSEAVIATAQEPSQLPSRGAGIGGDCNNESGVVNNYMAKATPIANPIVTQPAAAEPGELLPFDPLDIKMPEKLDVPKFRTAWAKWVRHNQKMSMPLDELAAEAQLKNLGRRSVESAVAAIETAIADRSTALPKSKESSRTAFVPPTPDEVDQYIKTLDTPVDFTGQEFCDHYKTGGWKLKHGRVMSDWEAAVRTWRNRKKREEITKAAAKPSGSAATNGAYKIHVPEPDRVRPHGRKQQPVTGNDTAAVASAINRHS